MLFVALLSKKLLTIHFRKVPFMLPPAPCDISFSQIHSVTLGPQCEVNNSTHAKSRYVLLLSTYFSCTVSLSKGWMLISLDNFLFGWEVHVAGVLSSTDLWQTTSILLYIDLHYVLRDNSFLCNVTLMQRGSIHSLRWREVWRFVDSRSGVSEIAFFFGYDVTSLGTLFIIFWDRLMVCNRRETIIEWCSVISQNNGTAVCKRLSPEFSRSHSARSAHIMYTVIV
jgi:hypothetical protein